MPNRLIIVEFSQQGSDPRQVPGRGLHRQGVDGPCPRPPQVEDGDRHRAWLPSRVRRHPGQGEADPRAPGGRQARRGRGAGRRPRPRGRGDRLAPRRGAPPPRPRPHRGPRDHEECRGVGAADAAQDRPQPGRRPGGAAGHRPPRRLSPQSSLVAQGAHRPVRGTRPVRRRPSRRRPRERDPRLRPHRVLDPRRPPGEGGEPVHGPLPGPPRRGRGGGRDAGPWTGVTAPSHHHRSRLRGDPGSGGKGRCRHS